MKTIGHPKLSEEKDVGRKDDLTVGLHQEIK